MMTGLLVVVLIALVFVHLRRQAHPRMAQVVLPALAVLALALALANILRPDSGSKMVGLASDYAEAQGYVLGEALAKAVPEGSTVLLAQWNTPVEPYGALVASERRGLRAATRGAGLTFLEVGPNPFDSATADPDAVNSLSETGIPPDMIEQWLAAHPDAAAVVSFCELHPRVLARPPRNLPPIFFVAHADPSEFLFQVVEMGRAGAVVLLKPGSDWRQQPPPGTPQEVFAVRYLLLTRENVDEIRARTSKG